MEGFNLEEVSGGHYRSEIKCFIRRLAISPKKELRFYSTSRSNNLPNLGIQFHLVTQRDYWYSMPHNSSQQLIYAPHAHTSNTKSFRLDLCASVYMSYDAFYSVVEGNLDNWGREMTHLLIDCTIGSIRKLVEDVLNKGVCETGEIVVDLMLKIECVLGGRLLPLRVNLGMVPASKTSIMQLPERMEIDGDECLNDECVICLEQFGERKIVCMPCSHMFHGDCLKTWLDKSHYCPICRYDMPTTSTQG